MAYNLSAQEIARNNPSQPNLLNRNKWIRVNNRIVPRRSFDTIAKEPEPPLWKILGLVDRGYKEANMGVYQDLLNQGQKQRFLREVSGDAGLQRKIAGLLESIETNTGVTNQMFNRVSGMSNRDLAQLNVRLKQLTAMKNRSTQEAETLKSQIQVIINNADLISTRDLQARLADLDTRLQNLNVQTADSVSDASSSVDLDATTDRRLADLADLLQTPNTRLTFGDSDERLSPIIPINPFAPSSGSDIFDMDDEIVIASSEGEDDRLLEEEAEISFNENNSSFLSRTLNYFSRFAPRIGRSDQNTTVDLTSVESELSVGDLVGEVLNNTADPESAGYVSAINEIDDTIIIERLDGSKVVVDSDNYKKFIASSRIMGTKLTVPSSAVKKGKRQES